MEKWILLTAIFLALHGLTSACGNNTLKVAFDLSGKCLRQRTNNSNNDDLLTLLGKYVLHGENITESGLTTSLTKEELEIQICGNAYTSMRTCATTTAGDMCPGDTAFINALGTAVDNHRTFLCENVANVGWRLTAKAKEYLTAAIGPVKGLFIPGGDACLIGQYQLITGSIMTNNSCIGRVINNPETQAWLETGAFTDPAKIALIRPKYMAILRCMNDFLRHSACSVNAQKGLLMYMSVQFFPPGVPISFVDYDRLLANSASQNPRGKIRVTCGVFGDPHILMYDTDKAGVNGHSGFVLVTCGDASNSSSDWINYITNDYFSVEGINTEQSGSTSTPKATFVSAVRVTLNRVTTQTVQGSTVITGSTKIAEYMASTSLPDTFSMAPASGDTVTINTLRPGKRIQIKFVTGGLGIIIGKAGDTFWFWVRMSDTIAQSSTGMFVQGCFGQPIPRASVGKRRKRAASICSASSQTFDGQNESCGFDEVQINNQTLLDEIYGSVVSGYTEVDTLDSELIDPALQSAADSVTSSVITIVCLVIIHIFM